GGATGGAGGGTTGAAGSAAAGGTPGGGGSGAGGSAPGTPMLQLTPATGAFGKVVQGQSSAALSFTVRNAGTAASAAVTAALSGTDAGMFTLTSTGCAGTVLEAGGACTLTVHFLPTQVGTRAATLTVGGGGTATAALSGEGIPPSALGAAPSAGDFMGVTVGSTGDVVFKITNSGGQTSGALATSITGAGAAMFTLTTDGCTGMTLAGAASCSLTVHFAPTARGAQSATLNVTGSPGGTLAVSLSGTGKAAAAFALSPATATLAAVDSGATGTETATIVVSNAGDLAGTPTITASDSANFAITDPCSGKSLAGGATCSVVVKLSPTKTGPLSATLTVTTPVTGMGTATVSGTGRQKIALTVAVAGAGTGTVTAPAGVEGDGISCPGNCSESYYQTAAAAPTVTLTATYDAASTTATWTAPCAASTTSCVVTLSAATAVTVTFAKKQFTVTITRSAEAAGATGTVSGGGLSCGATCTVSVAAGTQVALTAVPAAGSYFSAWSGGGCSGGTPTCTTSAITANTTIDAKFTAANVIFVTSTTYTVDQFASSGAGNPQAGADKLCKARAAAGTLTGPMTGRTWVSLLTLGTSAASSSAASARFGTKRGWVRPDGKPFGDTPASFLAYFGTGNKVFYPPGLDENGVLVTDGYFTTAALGDGCVGWTSTLISDYRAGGDPSAGGGGWDVAFGSPCNYAMRLYCASVDYTATITPPGVTAASKIAFITDGKFKPAGSTGLAAADAMCAQEATAAGYAGTFKAFISATSPATTPIARFPASSGPWVRPDGIPVGTFDQLNSMTPQLTAPIQVSPTLGYYGNAPVWTGAMSPIDGGTAATTCTSGTSWTAPAGSTVLGSVGQPYFTDFHLVNNYYSADCGQQFQLYCLQL
ncbi:MAG TPA: choice-of-anchor D domain-containing protein, partial [Polyangia bacterium]|nr:choice-of-anchor D domain-containing protein [Polyangia bacterium]